MSLRDALMDALEGGLRPRGWTRHKRRFVFRGVDGFATLDLSVVGHSPDGELLQFVRVEPGLWMPGLRALEEGEHFSALGAPLKGRLRAQVGGLAPCHAPLTPPVEGEERDRFRLERETLERQAVGIAQQLNSILPALEASTDARRLAAWCGNHSQREDAVLLALSVGDAALAESFLAGLKPPVAQALRGHYMGPPPAPVVTQEGGYLRYEGAHRLASTPQSWAKIRALLTLAPTVRTVVDLEVPHPRSKERKKAGPGAVYRSLERHFGPPEEAAQQAVWRQESADLAQAELLAQALALQPKSTRRMQVDLVASLVDGGLSMAKGQGSQVTVSVDPEHLTVDLILCLASEHAADSPALQGAWKGLRKRCAIGLRKTNLCWMRPKGRRLVAEKLSW